MPLKREGTKVHEEDKMNIKEIINKVPSTQQALFFTHCEVIVNRLFIDETEYIKFAL